MSHPYVRTSHQHWTDPPNVFRRPLFGASPTTVTVPVTTTTSPCDNGEVTIIESRFLVGLISRPDELSSQEIELLEKAFADSYSAIDCGARNMVNVTMITNLVADDTDSASRVLQGSTNTGSASYYYQSFTECKGRRNCKENTSAEKRRAVRKLQDDDYDECTCPPPSENEFLLSFNKTIRDLVSSGNLVSVFGANDNFAELEKVDCAGDLKPFETTALVTFEASDDGSDISDSELAALEAAFVDAYNEANAFNRKTCDLEFLVATEAKLTRVDNSRRLQGGGQYEYESHVQGRCRNCKDNPKPFEESQGRRNVQTRGHKDVFLPSFDQATRQLQTLTDACYCPRGQPEPRRAKPEEFQGSYNKIIKYLQEEGTVRAVTTVKEVDTSEPPETTLFVDITAPPRVSVSQVFDYTIRVMAIGEIAAVNVILTVEFPDQGSFVSSDPVGTLDGKILTFELGDLSEGDVTTEEVSITWQAPPSAVGVTTTVTVTADNADTVVGLLKSIPRQ